MYKLCLPFTIREFKPIKRKLCLDLMNSSFLSTFSLRNIIRDELWLLVMRINNCSSCKKPNKLPSMITNSKRFGHFSATLNLLCGRVDLSLSLRTIFNNKQIKKQSTERALNVLHIMHNKNFAKLTCNHLRRAVLCCVLLY